jgi:hypothetical protein
MIAFSEDYYSPEVAPYGAGGGGRRNNKFIDSSGHNDEWKLKLASLSKEEAEELYYYLQTKGII